MNAEKVKLLQVEKLPGVQSLDHVWAIMNAVDNEGPGAHLFSDNGGDPDGSLWLADASMFCCDIDALMAALAPTKACTLVDGVKVPYIAPLNSDESGIDFCGYQSDESAYLIDESLAEQFVKCQIEKRLQDEPEAVDAWHEGEAGSNDTIQLLIKTFGAFQVWGGGSVGNEPLSIVYPG